MPSDCQCSTACGTETIVKTKVISNKEATRRLEILEHEVKALKNENSNLRTSLRRAGISKKKIIKDLRDQLDKM